MLAPVGGRMNPNRGQDRITPAALACVAASAAHLWHQPLWPLWAYAICAALGLLYFLAAVRLDRQGADSA